MENTRWKPSHVEIAPNCPRCASSNTKFCYYNNYSLSQPRYFCKGCRRYWTKGGSLRNVPVGGGCRKNRRSRSAAARSQLQSGNAGLNYINNSSFSTGDSNESPERANIDLADVFAKFLNQPNHETLGDDSSSGNGDDSSVGNEMQLCDLTDQFESHNMMIPSFTSEDNQIDEFIAQNTNLIELQDILNEELPQDIYWSNDTITTTLSGVPWQNDFEPFICNNDDFNISNNEVAEDWSSTSLDLPSVGNFFQSF